MNVLLLTLVLSASRDHVGSSLVFPRIVLGKKNKIQIRIVGMIDLSRSLPISVSLSPSFWDTQIYTLGQPTLPPPTHACVIITFVVFIAAVRQIHYTAVLTPFYRHSVQHLHWTLSQSAARVIHGATGWRVHAKLGISPVRSLLYRYRDSEQKRTTARS